MAQSALKTPLGVPAFWETGENPPTEWSTWFGTLKMAIMARDNLQVDKLLKLKPAKTELPYPTLPTYEEPFDGETVDEERQKDQRNERRKVDWENECKKLEQNGPMIDELPWDEADLKVKSLIYLSLGAEGKRTFHQTNVCAVYHQRTSARVNLNIYPTTKQNIRPVPMLQVNATAQ